jgi:hypothetical protein
VTSASCGRGNGEAGVEAVDEAREGVAGVHGGDAGQAQLLDQPVLQGAVHAFDPALGLMV